MIKLSLLRTAVHFIWAQLPGKLQSSVLQRILLRQHGAIKASWPGTRRVQGEGERLQSPPWHVSVTADYSFRPFSNGAQAYAHIDDEFTSAYVLSNPADALYDPANDSYSEANFFMLRAGVKFDSWDISLFAKNLFNVHSNTGVNHSVPTSQLYLDSTFAPRIVGVTATVQL